MSFWIPRKRLWIREVLDERVKLLEEQGLRTSVGEQIVNILEEVLKEDCFNEGES